MKHFSIFVDSLLSVFPLWAVAVGLPIFGFLLALFLRIFVSRLLAILQFNKLCDRIGLSEFLRKGEVESTPSRIVGQLVFWFILLFALLLWSQVLHLGVVESFYNELASVIPNLLGGILILAIGIPVVVFLANFFRTVIRNTGMPYANLIARGVKWTGWFFVLLIAGEQVQFGRSIVGPTFHIILATIGLALALAFGLGCKDLARQAMEKFLRTMKENYRDRGGSDLEG